MKKEETRRAEAVAATAEAAASSGIVEGSREPELAPLPPQPPLPGQLLLLLLPRDPPGAASLAGACRTNQSRSPAAFISCKGSPRRRRRRRRLERASGGGEGGHMSGEPSGQRDSHWRTLAANGSGVQEGAGGCVGGCRECAPPRGPLLFRSMGGATGRAGEGLRTLRVSLPLARRQRTDRPACQPVPLSLPCQAGGRAESCPRGEVALPERPSPSPVRTSVLRTASKSTAPVQQPPGCPAPPPPFHASTRASASPTPKAPVGVFLSLVSGAGTKPARRSAF